MFTVIKSQKGHDQIVFEDNIFEKKRATQTSVEWRCIVKTCAVRGFTYLNYRVYNNWFDLKFSHNHLTNEDKIIKKTYMNKMEYKLTQPINTPRIIVNDVLKGCDESIITSIGNFNYIYRNLRNKKSRIINPTPFRYPTLKISQTLGTTYSNEQFYQYGPDNYGTLPLNENFLFFFFE